MRLYSKTVLTALVMLAVTQIIGWGTISLPAVIGDLLSRDVGISLPLVFAGSTTMLVVTGVTALLLSRAFVIYGARLVMAAGSVVAAAGFVLLANAHGPTLYFLAWVMLGVIAAFTRGKREIHPVIFHHRVGDLRHHLGRDVPEVVLGKVRHMNKSLLPA